MGLPINKIIIANSENDIVNRLKNKKISFSINKLEIKNKIKF